MTRAVWAMLAACAVAANSVGGYPADYRPFAPGESPPRFPLRECPLLASPGPEDFLALRPGGGCVIVKTSFRINGERRESRRHSYWIYNLIAVRDDELVMANEFDQRFPKWVWYTARPNHKPTASLSPADKERIWALQQESMFREAAPLNR